MEDVEFKEGKLISNFKQGDIITRLNPADNIHGDDLPFDPYNHIGEPFKFVGIFNNQIWLEKDPFIEKYSNCIEHNILRLSLFFYRYHWAIYEYPDHLVHKDIDE